jgi:hypothetical protein
VPVILSEMPEQTIIDSHPRDHPNRVGRVPPWDRPRFFASSAGVLGSEGISFGSTVGLAAEVANYGEGLPMKIPACGGGIVIGVMLA